jgi:hypothetical protein
VKWLRRPTAAMPKRFNGPGPGAYDVRGYLGKGSAYTMRTRHTDKEKFVGPGPSTYLPKISVSSEIRNRSCAQYSFGTAERFKTPQINYPGPAEYTPPLKSTNGGSGVNGKIGKSPRKGLTDGEDVAPGPGAYTPRDPGKLGGKTMAFRVVKDHTIVSPGPAAYAPEVADGRGPSWGFGGATRSTDFGSSIAPGPGAYDVKRDLQGPSASLTPRRDNIFDLI